MDYSNWEQWWRPNAQFIDSSDDSESTEEYFQYAISEDCNSCSLDNNKNSKYTLLNEDYYVNGDRTAYYMTGTLFGCLATHKAEKDCRWDYDTYTCNYCSTNGLEADLDLTYHVISPHRPTDWIWWNEWGSNQVANDSLTWIGLQMGLCGVWPNSTYTDMVPTTRDECNAMQDNIKPSIGTDGRFCVCVKPNESFDAETSVSIDDEELATFKGTYFEDAQMERNEEEDTSSMDDVIELYQSDFVDGTYRIKKSGTYKIMEDTEFDFNAGDLYDPNSGTSWWPTTEQRDQYPGTASTGDEYYLGFIAGITVETDDVVIDLNGHSIAMSKALYYQQRFFSCIALKSVAFPLNQGPGFFGFDPKFANNVVIKNGVIGLSSHHGIHGHNNKDVVIENVQIKDFETHGVQMSYFFNLRMSNVEIGPSSNVAYLKGEYAYARWTVQALERIQKTEYNDIFPITFSGRTESLEFDDIIENLRNLMDIAFKSVMGVEEYDDDDEDYLEAKELFISDDGLPYGAVMYGLFLNLKFANVFTIHPSVHHAAGALLENVHVHDLNHKSLEYVRMDKWNEAMYRNQFNAPLDANAILGDQILPGSDNITWADTTYIGSALSDASILLAIVTEDWGEKGLIFLPDDFTTWALGESTWDDEKNDGHPYLGCNNDRMSHVPKGVIGVRMDGVEDVVFSDLHIADIHESGDLGSELCGDYWDGNYKVFHGHGNTLQNPPYLTGYTGNRAHGIFSDWSEYVLDGDTKIHDISCDTGLVRGIGMYTASHLTWGDDATVSVRNLNAGSGLYGVDTEEYDHPYNPSVAKPFHIVWSHTETKANNTFVSILDGEPESVTMECIFGRDGVNESDWTFSVDNAGCDSVMEQQVIDFYFEGFVAESRPQMSLSPKDTFSH